jgi:aspartate racemase
MEALAERYVGEMRAVQPQGPYLLGGICSGAVVAYEMAQQLHSQGERVAVLAMIEPARLWGAGIRRYVSFGASVVRRFAGRAGHHSRSVSQLGPSEQGAYLRTKMKLVANSWAMRRYDPRPYVGRLDLFLSSGSLKIERNPQLGWRELAAGGYQVHEIPGTHDTITGNNNTKIEEDHMCVLAGQLNVVIDEALKYDCNA